MKLLGFMQGKSHLNMNFRENLYLVSYLYTLQENYKIKTNF